MLVTAGFAPSTFRFASGGGGGRGLSTDLFGGVDGREIRGGLRMLRTDSFEGPATGGAGGIAGRSTGALVIGL